MNEVSDEVIATLTVQARKIRERVIDMLEDAGSGHTAGPLGMADIFAALYFHVLRHDPHNPTWEARDRLVLSSGHTVPVRYAAMALAGYFPEQELRTLRMFGSRLQGHPERTRLPGLETTSGPLGEGLSQAVGMAYAARMNGDAYRTYCVMSDAEQQCGMTWEAVMFAAHHTLAHVTAIIDRNGIQIGGLTESILALEPLRAKYEAFGWHVFDVDGHNIRAVIETIAACHTHARPTVIIAHTVPGKGVPQIENQFAWHGRVPTKKEEHAFLEALRHQDR